LYSVTTGTRHPFGTRALQCFFSRDTLSINEHATFAIHSKFNPMVDILGCVKRDVMEEWFRVYATLFMRLIARNKMLFCYRLSGDLFSVPCVDNSRQDLTLRQVNSSPERKFDYCGSLLGWSLCAHRDRCTPLATVA
jgi:hypothetical protein